MKRIILLIAFLFVGYTLFSQTMPSGQTSNNKKKRPFVNKTPPKNWGKKKYTNPIKTKLKDNATTWDIGVTAGVSNSLTDIFGNSDKGRGFVMDMQLQQTNPSGGLFIRYKFSPAVAINLSGNYVALEGADSISTVENNTIRNNSFKNTIYELSARIELYRPKPTSLFQPRRKKTEFDFYGYTGIAGFYHKPELFPGEQVQNSSYYFIDPNDYSKVQLGFPFGVGFYFTFPTNFRLGGEGYWMKTFTDYLDGFTTIHGTGNDNYLAAKISFSYIFKHGRKRMKYRW